MKLKQKYTDAPDEILRANWSTRLKFGLFISLDSIELL